MSLAQWRKSFQVAAEWRSTFQRDVMLDVVGYRLHGHNELDEPAFTQPQMYHRIREMQPVLELYKQSLLNESTVDPSYIEVSIVPSS